MPFDGIGMPMQAIELAPVQKHSFHLTSVADDSQSPTLISLEQENTLNTVHAVVQHAQTSTIPLELHFDRLALPRGF